MGTLGLTSVLLPSASAAASTPQVTPPSSDGLVLHLDAASPGATPATVWRDLSNSANDGTVGGTTGVTLATDGPAAYVFPGGLATRRVDVRSRDAVIAAPVTAYTKLLWFRRDLPVGFHNLMSTPGTVGQASHFLYFVSTDDATSYGRLTVGNNSTPAGYDRLRGDHDVGDEWTFVAATFSTSEGFRLSTFTDLASAAVPARTVSAAYDAGTDDLDGPIGVQLGAYRDADDATFKGRIATALLYSRALSLDEVRAYHAATVSRFHPSS